MTTRGEVERVLRDQWAVLRAWIEDERVLDHASEPSGLERVATGRTDDPAVPLLS